MYNPPQFLTAAVVAEVLAEFSWPAPYTIEDWLPDGIEVAFPGCALLFVEGFESEMDLEISSRSAGIDPPVSFTHVLHALRSSGHEKDADVVLTNDMSSSASLSKVKNGLRDLCALTLAYLTDALRGDPSWATAYKAVYPDRRS